MTIRQHPSIPGLFSGLTAFAFTWILAFFLVSWLTAPPAAPREAKVVQAGMVFFTNTPPGGVPTLFTQLEFPLRSNAAYKVQLTLDFVNFRDVWAFTNTEGKGRISWTVNPATGPWPRLLEK